jgi:hypothetical protein
VVVFGYLTATLATFFIDRDAEGDDAELASVKSIQALQAEITRLRTDIQALVQRDIVGVHEASVIEPKRNIHKYRRFLDG